MVKFILIKSPDEWATTKQACRDELVVYLFFSPIYRSLYFNVLSTVYEHQVLHFIPAPSLALSSTLRKFAMEKFNISYSTKNIPLPSRSDYLQ